MYVWFRKEYVYLSWGNIGVGNNLGIKYIVNKVQKYKNELQYLSLKLVNNQCIIQRRAFCPIYWQKTITRSYYKLRILEI